MPRADAGEGRTETSDRSAPRRLSLALEILVGFFQSVEDFGCRLKQRLRSRIGDFAYVFARVGGGRLQHLANRDDVMERLRIELSVVDTILLSITILYRVCLKQGKFLR